MAGSLTLVSGSAAKNKDVKELAARLDSARARIAKAAKAARAATESAPIMDTLIATGSGIGAAALDEFVPALGPVAPSALGGLILVGAGWAMEAPALARGGAMMMIPSIYLFTRGAIATARAAV